MGTRMSIESRDIANERRATSRERNTVRRAARHAKATERAFADFAYRQTLQGR